MQESFLIANPTVSCCHFLGSSREKLVAGGHFVVSSLVTSPTLSNTVSLISLPLDIPANEVVGLSSWRKPTSQEQWAGEKGWPLACEMRVGVTRVL